MTYCPTSIREVINWFPFMDTMGYTADMIENDITLLPSMMKIFSMFQMSFKYEDERDDENDVKIINKQVYLCIL